MTPNAPGIESMPVELKCAIVLLEHIRDTIPLRPSERQITREEANALLADRTRLQAQLEAVRRDAERLEGDKRTYKFALHRIASGAGSDGNMICSGEMMDIADGALADVDPPDAALSQGTAP